MNILLLLAGIFGVIAGAVLFRAWVVVTLWGWFMVPVGLPAIAITTAIGFSLIFGMFTQHLETKSSTTTKRDITEAIGDILGKAFGGPLVVLTFAWVVTWFM